MDQSGLKNCLRNDGALLRALLGPLRNECDIDHVVSVIIQNFGDIRGLMSASREELLSLDGMPANVVEFFLNLKRVFNQILNDDLEVNFQKTYPGSKSPTD